MGPRYLPNILKDTQIEKSIKIKILSVYVFEKSMIGHETVQYWSTNMLTSFCFVYKPRLWWLAERISTNWMEFEINILFRTWVCTHNMILSFVKLTYMYTFARISIRMLIYIYICVYMHVHMYIYIYMHTCIFLVVYIEVRCNLATFRVSPSEKIFSSSKFVGSTGLGRRKIAQTFSLSPWRLVVGPFRYFWLVAWISARKPGSKSSIYGFTINRWGCNGYTWIFAINEGNKYMYI